MTFLWIANRSSRATISSATASIELNVVEISVEPKPGRSGAITRHWEANLVTCGRHISSSNGKPCSSTKTGRTSWSASFTTSEAPGQCCCQFHEKHVLGEQGFGNLVIWALCPMNLCQTCCLGLSGLRPAMPRSGAISSRVTMIGSGAWWPSGSIRTSKDALIPPTCCRKPISTHTNSSAITCASSIPFFLWLRLVTGHRLAKLHRYHLGTQMRDAAREVSIFHGALPEASSAVLAAHLLGRADSPSEEASRSERRTRLHTAINRLESLDREVLSLRHFEQLTTAEVATVLGINKAAAGKRYVRALARLRESLVGQTEELGNLP